MFSGVRQYLEKVGFRTEQFGVILKKIWQKENLEKNGEASAFRVKKKSGENKSQGSVLLEW